MNNEEIKQKSVSGIVWKLLERLFAQGVTLIVSIVLARILSPDDYTVVSLVIIFFTFANILITGGLNTALIQKKDADEIDYSSVLIASVVFSIVIYTLLFFCAPYFANLYSQPSLIPILRVMGISLIVTAIKAVWCAYISAHLEFRKFFFATLGGTIASAFIGIALALTGWGAWAIVAQQMTNTIVDTIILVLLVRIKMPFRFDNRRFLILFRYSWKILVSSVVSTVYNETIPLLVGVKYDAANLSYYTKGRQFPGNISSTITNTLASVLFPVVSKFQESKDNVLKCSRMFIRTTSFVVFPMMLGFFAVADNFVWVVLTEKWMQCVYYMRVFCVACMFSMIHIGNCETIKALGRSDVYLVIEIIKKVCYLVVIVLFVIYSKSPRTLVLAFIVNEIIAIIVNSVPNIFLIGYKIRYQVADLVPNLLTSVLMALAVMALGFLKMNPCLKLSFQVVVGIVLYVGISFLIKNKSINTLRTLIAGFRSKKMKQGE